MIQKVPAIHITSASPSQRIKAGIIDTFILLVMTVIFFKSFDFTRLPIQTNAQIELAVLGAWNYLIFIIIPHAIFSQTIGECLQGIKVISQKHERLKLLECLKRDLIYRLFLLALPGTVLNENGIAIHDKFAKSVAVIAE
jgi:uncharacterized RDD family membrane protein YckC